MNKSRLIFYWLSWFCLQIAVNENYARYGVCRKERGNTVAKAEAAATITTESAIMTAEAVNQNKNLTNNPDDEKTA